MAGLLVLSGSLVASEHQESYELKVQHFLPTSAVTHKDLLVPWAEKITQATAGRLQFEIYPAMQLGGKAPQLFDQARRGTVDIAWTLAGYTPGRFPRMEVFELPFMAIDAAATSQAAYEFYREFAQEEFAAVKVLLVHTHAPGKLHMRGQPVRSLADLQGTKVRAPTRVANMLLNSLGATAIGMPVPELPTALASGVVDGALVPYEVAYPLRLHELTDSHTDVASPQGLYTAVFLLVMNKRKFEQLPAELQAALEDNSGLSWARAAGELWDASDAPGLAAAQAAGDEFFLIEGAELESWQARGREVWERWIAEMSAKQLDGEELITQAQALIEKYSAGP